MVFQVKSKMKVFYLSGKSRQGQFQLQKNKHDVFQAAGKMDKALCLIKKCLRRNTGYEIEVDKVKFNFQIQLSTANFKP